MEKKTKKQNKELLSKFEEQKTYIIETQERELWYRGYRVKAGSKEEAKEKFEEEGGEDGGVDMLDYGECDDDVEIKISDIIEEK
jgi:hypothetical protein